jgi:hypothetical protein
LAKDETEGKRAKQSVWRGKMSDKKKTTRALVAEKLEVSNVEKTKTALEDAIVHILLAARQENAPCTPVFALAQFLLDCLADYDMRDL